MTQSCKGYPFLQADGYIFYDLIIISQKVLAHSNTCTYLGSTNEKRILDAPQETLKCWDRKGNLIYQFEFVVLFNILPPMDRSPCKPILL